MGLEEKLLRAMDPERVKPEDIIVLGGVSIVVEDFVRIWNGEVFLPKLSPHEEEMEDALDELEDFEDASGLIFSALPFLSGASRASARLKKFLEVRGMILRHKGGLELLNLNRVLAALKGRKARFNQLEEFVATLSGVTPSLEDAHRVEDAAAEHMQIGDAELHYSNEHSAQALDAVTTEARADLVASILGLTTEEMEQLPLFILEHVAFGVTPARDELVKLSTLKNIGSHWEVTFLQFAQYLTLYGGWGVFADGLRRVLVDLPRGIMQMEVGLLFLLYGAVLFLGYKPKRAKIRSSLASSQKRYSKLYRQFEQRIQALQETPYGRVQVALLREIAREAHGELGRVDELSALLAQIEDSEDFNQYAGLHPVRYDNPEELLRLLQNYQSRELLEEPLEEGLRDLTQRLGEQMVRF